MYIIHYCAIMHTIMCITKYWVSVDKVVAVKPFKYLLRKFIFAFKAHSNLDNSIFTHYKDTVL